MEDSAAYVPTDSMRRAVAAALLDPQDNDGSDIEATHENLSGQVRVSSRIAGCAKVYCSAFGECADAGCGCYRLKQPQVRRRFRQMVVAKLTQDSPTAVRIVTVGAGALLTDFEILLDLWRRGVRIDAVVAIDTAYGDEVFKNEYTEALRALAIFFAPARVFSFGTVSGYVAAARTSPTLYAQAHAFLRCDAAAVPTEDATAAATAALLPGCLAYELSNSGGWHSHAQDRRAEIERYLPSHLQRGARASSSMSCQVRDWTPARACAPGGGADAEHTIVRTHAPVGAARRDPLACVLTHPLWRQVCHHDDERGGAARLREMVDPQWISSEMKLSGQHEAEAVRHLTQGARSRAEENGLRAYRVVYPRRMPVRGAPSREAEVVGSCSSGAEFVAAEVTPDGWVRLSSLDTYWGYQKGGEGDGAGWMLTHAPDVGELLREIVLLEGDDIEDEAWMPEVF